MDVRGDGRRGRWPPRGSRRPLSSWRRATERRRTLQIGHPAYRRNCRWTRRSGSGTGAASERIVVSTRGASVSPVELGHGCRPFGEAQLTWVSLSGFVQMAYPCGCSRRQGWRRRRMRRSSGACLSMRRESWAGTRGRARRTRGWARRAWCSTTSARSISRLRPGRPVPASPGSPRSGAGTRRSPSSCSDQGGFPLMVNGIEGNMAVLVA